MSIGFQCPGCQRPYSVDSALAGKRVRCKHCGNEMRVPTPSRPASASASKSKPKPPVPADVYRFDDELVEPMPAPVATREAERPSRGSGGLFGSQSKKKRKRRSSDDGPWGVPLRWFVFFLFVTAGTVNGRIKAGVITPDMLPVVNYVRFGATLLMVVSVVGALVSFLRGNRSAFRGESILGQVAWGWAILGLTLTQLMFWRGPSRAEAGGDAGRSGAPVVAAPRIPEIPRATLEAAASRGPMIPPPNVPIGPDPDPDIDIARPVQIQPPDFPFPGGAPSPPIMGPRPGFPGPPPRPNIPMPPRPNFPRPPGFGPHGR